MIDDPGWPVWLLMAVFAGFLVDWAAIAFHWVKIKPFTKIGAIVLLIFWTLTAGNWQVDLMLGLLILAQGFGLAGDVFLLFSDRWFMWGLGAFLAGNFLYLSLLVIRFRKAVQPQVNSEWVSWRLFLSLGIWGLIVAVFYLLIYSPIKSKANNVAFRTAIQFYALILSILVAFSFLTVLSVPQTEGFIWALPIGSALFIFSDAILAYNRFIKKVLRGQLWVRIAYHSAQFLLAWGFLRLF